MSQGAAPATADRPPGVDRRWALLALAIVVVLLVVGVGISAVLPSGSSPSASPGDQSAYAQLFGQIGPNGEVTKEMALEAFSLAIAPLPGVTVPNGAPPQDYERADGTFAVQWIQPYLDQITPEQKAVVDAALAPDPNAPVHTPSTSGANADIELADETPEQYFSDFVSAAIPTIASKLGRTLDTSWSVTLNPTEEKANGKAALAWDAPLINPIRGLVGCDIHVNPSLSNSGDEALIRASMAHEIFHCFQFEYLDAHGGNSGGVPDWIMEGEAEWAGEAVGGPTGQGAGWWANYLTNPDTALWQRTYDAVGFYQHLAEEGIDPWSRFDPILSAWTSAKGTGTANSDAFKAAGAAADTFLDTWASGFFRDAQTGGAWYATGPWSVTAKAAADVVVIHPGDNKNAAAKPATDALWTIASASDIIEVRGHNHVRMHAGSLPQLPVDQRWICTKENGCMCPPGKSYSGPELEDMGVAGAGYPGIDFGITGSLDGANVTVIGHSLDEFCKPTPSQGTPPPPCQSNCGHSNGDPHLRTVNRYAYDFQAAGEFTLLRSPDSSIEIQARQEPYAGTSTLFRGVSINTAIAVLDNGHNVSVYATSTGLDLHVDGQEANPNAPPDLGAGAAVTPVSKGFEIDFPDGSVVTVVSVAPWGVSAVVTASPALLADGMGLLGPITPGGMGVPALPDGTQLPAAPDQETRDKTLYGQFADAWRVTDATTLFDYDPGKSTESYTDRNFPSDADRHALEAALASPDPNQQAAATSACAAITDPDLQTDCEYDVFATGDPGFAQQYSVIQDLYDSGIVPPTLPPPSSTGMHGATQIARAANVLGATIGPDDTVYLSVDDGAGNAQILAIDPKTASVQQSIPVRVAGDIHFAAGSIWATGLNLDANNQDCNATRFDPATLAVQATFAMPCSFGFPGPRLVSMGDTVWLVDTSHYDLTSDTGSQLVRIDPATNQPATGGVPIGESGDCCFDSRGAVFCYCGKNSSDVWRLTPSDSAFEDLGSYYGIYPAGTGFWANTSTALVNGQQLAVYVDGPGGPTASIPLDAGPTQNATVVGGDAASVYLRGDQTATQYSGYPLLRQPADGSAPVQIATSPTWDTPDQLDFSTLDYPGGNTVKFALPDGFVTIWNFNGTEYLQWAPLP